MDDEILALNLLEAILKEIGEVEVVGVFMNPIEGLENLESLNPDVVFLDIEMPGLNGITLAEKIESLSLNTEIVFVTAYDQYALDAFNVQAVDYVLKPIEKERLKKTIERIAKRKKPAIVSVTQTKGITTQLLGSFQILDSHQERVNWRTKKAKELAAYLIHHDKPVNRHRIMEDLWPDTHIEKASTLLHTTVYQLRKKFRDCGIEEPIAYKSEEYALTVKIDSDVKQIQYSLAHGEIRKILDLYKNDYLSQEDYAWAQSESERMRAQVIRSLEDYVFKNCDGVYDDLYKKVLDKLCELEPWDELYILKLIDYYIKLGNNKEAISTMNRYIEGLKKELGIEPSKNIMDRISTVTS